MSLICFCFSLVLAENLFFFLMILFRPSISGETEKWYDLMSIRKSCFSSVRTQKRRSPVLIPFTSIEMTGINYLSCVTRLCHILRTATDICPEYIAFVSAAARVRSSVSGGEWWLFGVKRLIIFVCLEQKLKWERDRGERRRKTRVRYALLRQISLEKRIERYRITQQSYELG